ncbi:MAG: dolichol-phosphate mannosyltransferase [Desulfobacterales bacterium SG8_35]|nr:MAG: dolichol-phosphate mannosyltransferase [Desulfobacterales bacterium SG8_35]
MEGQGNKAGTGKDPELSVLVPVHNEEQNIAALIGEIRAALDQLLDYEIVYVDDGSTDDTYGELLKAARNCKNLRIVQHRNNCGQSTALCTGVKAARAARVVTLDGDGQNDPADIPKLWARSSEADPAEELAVCGYRRRRQDTLVKKLSSRIANGFRQFVLKDATPDTGCGIKLFPRAAFLELPYFDHMHRFLPALFLRRGGRVVSVEVNHRPRTRGQSHYGMANRLWIGLVDTFGVAWLQRRIKHPKIVEEKNNEN